MLPDPGPSHGDGPVPGVRLVAGALERSARRARLRRGAMVSVFTVAGLTVCAEVGLRVAGYRQAYFETTINKTDADWVALTTGRVLEEHPSSVLRYGMRPGASCDIGPWRFRVTRHGTRGEDFPLEKPPGERRLLCLGDSFAFGMWSDEDETLVGHVARRANERERELGSGATWRAVNLGVPGYHSGQQLVALEETGLALDPDVVMLFFNSNDIEREGFFFDEQRGVLRRDLLPLPTPLRRWLWNSHLYGWIVTRHRRLVEAGDVPPHMNPAVPYAYVREDNQKATCQSISRMAELCRQRGVPFFFVNMPHLTWQGELLREDWSMLPLVEWAENLRHSLQIPGVNLLGLFRGYADGVDRLEEGAPPDFLLDEFGSDHAIRAMVDWARARAAEDGVEWRTLGYQEKAAYIVQYPGDPPLAPDFHLTGEGYGHLARVVYAAMREQGVLP